MASKMVPGRKMCKREVIRQLFREADRPLGARDVYRAALRELPGLSIVSVYRALAVFRSEGWLVPVELPGSPTRFEARPGAPRHYFQCRRCGRVEEVSAGPEWPCPPLPTGFRLEHHEVLLFGLCATCGD